MIREQTMMVMVSLPDDTLFHLFKVLHSQQEDKNKSVCSASSPFQVQVSHGYLTYRLCDPVPVCFANH